MNDIQTHLVETWEEMTDLRSYILSQTFEHLVIDVETDSSVEKKAKLFGIGLCFSSDEAFYIPIRKNNKDTWWTEDQEKKIANFIYKLCQNHKVIGHNIIYDALVIENNWNFDIVPYIYSDTILQKHIIDEERPFGLKEVAVKYLGKWADKAQETLYANIKANGGSTTQNNMEMWKADTNVLGEYCAYDTILCYRLFHIFEEKIIQENLYDLFYKDEIMPLYKEVTIPMKRYGFPIDVEYFKKLNEEISKDIAVLEDRIQTEIQELVEPFNTNLLNEEYPVKRGGKYPIHLAKVLGKVLPEKNGKVTLSKKAIEEANDGSDFYKWLLGEDCLPEEALIEGQVQWFYDSNPGEKYFFNLKSNNHQKWLFFEELNLQPLSKTDKGEPQVNDDFLETAKKEYPWVQDLIDYKKLLKIQSTYIQGALDEQIDGVIYASFIQFGPPSGRYACRGFNLQNIPRVKEEDSGLSEIVLKYVNSIKRGFIAPKGYKIVNCDQSQLEPRAFAEAAADPLLQQAFINDEDLYGSIAKNIWNLECSANEVKKKYPEKRQQAKCFIQGTKVDTLEGVKSIEDVKIGDEVRTFYGYKKVLAITSRESPIGIFCTNRGFLGCTPDHKIFSEKLGWVEAEKFNVGDTIIHTPKMEKEQKLVKLPLFSSASFKNGFKNPYAFLEFDEDWAYILGAFLGDGVGAYQNKTRKEKAGFNSHLISSYVGLCGLSEDFVLDKWSGLIKKFGWELSITKTKTGKNKEITLIKLSDFEFTKLFQNTFKAFKTSNKTGRGRKNLEIRDFVFNSPLRVKLSFLAGLLDTDGYLKNNKTKKTSDVAIASKSFQLITDIHKLLEDIGVEAITRLDWNKTYERFYYILNLTKKGIQTLSNLGLQEFLVCPRKKEAISEMKNIVLQKNTNKKHPSGFKKWIPLNETQTVYDITVEEVHEFFASNIRVHNCFSLATVYGASAYRIAQLMGIDYEEAQQIIDNYLNAYPGLKDYMKSCDYQVCTYGQVKTKYGRIRHLPLAKHIYAKHGMKILDKKYAMQKGLEESRWTFKNMLNLAKNFPIQGVAAHIMNRSAININRRLKDLNAIIVAQVHDELTIIADEKKVEEVKAIVKDCMENTLKLSVPLKADPLVADNWSEAK